MTVFLTILKTVGIVLLVLLGILFTAVLLVLLVPVRYRAQGAYQEKLTGNASVTWLAHLVSVRVSFDEKLSFCVRIAGIRILPKREKKRGKKSENVKENSQTDQEPVAASGRDGAGEEKEGEPGRKQETVSRQEPPTAPAALEEQEAAGEMGEALAAEGDAVPDAVRKEEGTFGQEEQTAEKGPEKEIWGFLDGLFLKIYAIFRNCGEKYAAICAKIEQIRKSIARYLAMIRREETKQLAVLVFGQFKKILRHVLPGTLQIYVCIGTGDPASTGQLLAVQGMLYPFLGQRLQIVPDFEEKRLEGSFFLKGHITLAVFLMCAFRILISRNFRKLVKMIRKKEEA